MIQVQLLPNYPGEEKPTFATAGSAAIDLRAAIDEPHTLYPGDFYGSVITIPTGIAVAMPLDTVGLIFPRSGLGSKGLSLRNTVGVIDSDYRGEIKLMLQWRPASEERYEIKPGDRIAQMLFINGVDRNLIEVSQLPPTGRGPAGFGSTGV